MNYLGRLVTNVRGFYSEINSATLTGAIDVVVIRQEDGSFVASPFHVRFGKLGVLRSREKIVDIEVNGNPVPLHMKLGDAGEAFFVEEIEEPLDSRNEMATSPIPPFDDNTIAEEVPDFKIDEKEGKEADKKTEEKENKDESSNKLTDNDLQQECDSPTVPVGDDLGSSAELDRDNLKTPTKDMDTESQITEEAVTPTNECPPLANQEDKSEDKSEVISVECIARAKSEEEQSTEEAKKAIEEFLEDQDCATVKELHVDIPNSTSSHMVDICPSYSVSDSILIPGRGRAEILSDSDSSNWMTDSTSPPVPHSFPHDYPYPLSDLDSPIGSPPDGSGIHMRPGNYNPQHCLSDTEAEIQHCQESIREDEISWDWGKLPKGSENLYPLDRKITDLKREETGFHHRKKPHHSRAHKIKEEGIYLDDLTSVDDEIARLYLNQALKTEKKTSQFAEDIESGIGQSLPSSPTAEESLQKTSNVDSYHDIAMSLCGELRSGKVPLESFMKRMVNYEDLSNNPALLANPNLVIRINDRYYNWQIAAPMLMSYIVFQRPLQQETARLLVKQHMPRKEKRRSYWFSWRQNYDDQSSDDEDDTAKDNHRPRLHSNSRKHLNATSATPSSTPTRTAEYLEGEGDGDIDREVEEQDPLLTGPRRERNISECTSGNESDMVNFRKTTRLSSEQLANLNLREGANSIEFSVTTKYQGTAACQATIYLWNYDDRIVISDIDGTITKSDVLGQILPVVGSSWAQSGVAHFFNSIQSNGYKLLYLSARAIGQAQLTRDYLKSVKQGQICLPDGPLLLSPASLIKAFHREVIEKKPEEFKISALRDILSLFPNKNPFYGGFGNKINDVYSYRAVGVSVSRIFTINHKGEVTNELTTTFQSSYLRLSDLVDQMFPPYKKQQDSMRPTGLVAPDEFSSFTYWRNPLPHVEIEGFDKTQDEADTTTAN